MIGEAALRAEVEKLQLAQEAAEERHAMELHTIRAQYDAAAEELHAQLDAANKRWEKAEQALKKQSQELALLKRARYSMQFVAGDSKAPMRNMTQSSKDNAVDLALLAKIGDDPRAAAGRRRAAAAAAARSSLSKKKKKKESSRTCCLIVPMAIRKPSRRNQESPTLKRSPSSVSRCMAIKHAETAAAVAALQARSSEPVTYSRQRGRKQLLDTTATNLERHGVEEARPRGKHY